MLVCYRVHDLTHVPPGFGCSPLAGTGGHQYRLGELLRLTPSPASLDSPRSADDVLLLSAISPRRPTLLHYPDRPLHRPSPRSVPPSPHMPRRHFALSGCPSEQEVETSCGRQYLVEGNLRATYRSEVSQVWLGSPPVRKEEETVPNPMSCIAHVCLPFLFLIFAARSPETAVGRFTRRPRERSPSKTA